MTFVGITPSGGNISLPQPVQVQLNRKEDAPADGFTGIFPLSRSFGNLTGIRIYDRNGELCFDGIVDEQRESCTGKLLLTLISRSRAALLLDNEAIPQTYCMPSLATIFARHVQPYGFNGFYGSTKMFSGALTVTKGMSEWQAAAAFCTRFLNVQPCIRDGVFDASGEMPQGGLQFDNSAGTRHSVLTVENKYCSLLSELLMQSGTGGTYAPARRDDRAVSLGIRRRRCITAGQNAENLIRAARRKAYSVQLDCPGEIPAQLFMNACVRDKVMGTIDGLYVSEIDYTMDSGGEMTRFVLRGLE